jgi:hypothetical protein
VIPEMAPLQWFHVEVPHHLVSWAVFNTHFTSLDVVSDEEVSNVDVSSASST